MNIMPVLSLMRVPKVILVVIFWFVVVVVVVFMVWEIAQRIILKWPNRFYQTYSNSSRHSHPIPQQLHHQRHCPHSMSKHWRHCWKSMSMREMYTRDGNYFVPIFVIPMSGPSIPYYVVVYGRLCPWRHVQSHQRRIQLSRIDSVVVSWQVNRRGNIIVPNVVVTTVPPLVVIPRSNNSNNNI